MSLGVTNPRPLSRASLGQRVGAFLLDRVLGGQDQERLGQRRRWCPAEGDLALLHRLEQRDWTLAGARLISSASTMFAKTGPFRGVECGVLARVVDQACR